MLTMNLLCETDCVSVDGNPNGRPNAMDVVGKGDEQGERIACLEAIIAVLIEKNERMRMQLMK
jgi:hypothetical protein